MNSGFLARTIVIIVTAGIIAIGYVTYTATEGSVIIVTEPADDDVDKGSETTVDGKHGKSSWYYYVLQLYTRQA